MEEENIKNKANSHLLDMMEKMSFSELISATNPQNVTKKDGQTNEHVEENKIIVNGKEENNQTLVNFDLLDDVAALTLNVGQVSVNSQ